MKIANILGLYLGCKVKLKSGHIFTLHGVYKNNGMFKLNKRSTFNEPLKNCKLLLTPLSKITEEDEKELASRCDIKYFENIDELGLCYVDERKEEYEDFNFREIFWLASKGYDIGLVEDEYKEITT